MLTQQQHEEFMERGFTRVSNAFSQDTAAKMVARFWSFLEQHQNVRRDEPASWTEGIVRGIADLKHESEFQQIGSAKTLSVIDQLLGKNNWQHPSTWGQILATFPAEEWSWTSLCQGRVDVETVQWHTDYEYDSRPDDLAGVQVFPILADLDPGGGATLVIEGSPGVIRNFVRDQPPEVLQKMKRARLALMNSHPWFQSISEPISLPRPEEWIAEQRTVIDGIPVAVAELTGKAGDVVFCHPWLLHSSPPNCNETPRLMCTQRIRSHADRQET